MEERETFVQSLLAFMGQVNVHVDREDTEKPLQDFMTDCISACMENFKKEQKLRMDLQEEVKRLEVECKDLREKIEDKDAKIHELEGEVVRLEMLVSANGQKFKQEREKLGQERDQARKDFARISGLCNQHAHEVKKRENEYLRLQEQLRKSLGEKELQYKNSIEIMNSLHKTGPSVPIEKCDDQFLYFIRQGHMENNRIVRERIKALTETVEKVFASIRNVLENLRYEVDWKALDVERMDQFNNEVEFRLRHFECCLRNVQKLQDDPDFPKESIPVLKQLLDGYKEMFDSNILSLLNSD